MDKSKFFFTFFLKATKGFLEIAFVQRQQYHTSLHQDPNTDTQTKTLTEGKVGRPHKTVMTSLKLPTISESFMGFHTLSYKVVCQQFTASSFSPHLLAFYLPFFTS